MTVKELIEKLKTVDLDIEVMIEGRDSTMKKVTCGENFS